MAAAGSSGGETTSASSAANIQRGVLRRYGRDFRTFADARVARVQEDLDDEWPLFVMVTAVIGLVLAGAIRVFQASLLGSERVWVGWLAIAPGSILAALCIGVLSWVFWGIHREPGERRPYVVALLTVTTTILVCTEAFAGATTMLWQRGVIGTGSDLQPDLWAAEQHYLWHLVDAVPLLDAPQLTNWQDPQVFADRSSGILLLIFKILVLVPLLQLAITGYRLAETRFLAISDPKGRRWLSFWQRKTGRSAISVLNDHSRGTRDATTREVWGEFVGFLFLTGIAYLALTLVGEPTSVVDRWASAHLAGGVDVLSVHIPLRSLQVGADCLVALAFLGTFWSLVSELAGLGLPRIHSLGALAGALGACLALVVLATVVASAATLALLHVDVAEARPMIPDQNELEAALEWHARHVVETIPFVDITGSVDWTLRYEFVDRWSGAIQVVLRLFFFFIVFVPVTWAVRAVAHSRRPPATAHLDAFYEFSDLLAKIHRELDDAEARILAKALREATAGRSPATPGSSDDESPHPPIWAAERLIRALEPAFRRADALFGGEEVGEAADATVAATIGRLRAIEEDSRGPYTYDFVCQRLEQARSEAASRIVSFRVLAEAALRKAAVPGPR